ncbi:hypothetical protein, partial [Eubacterium aggregans]|uniref:hypothetical protein n=1 Tax=Eubacterium aggregans TaxID=81409 RepID=UPI0023EFEF67
MQGWSKSLKSDWLPATAALRLQSWTRHSDAQVQQVFLFFLRKKPVSLANHRSPAAIRLRSYISSLQLCCGAVQILIWSTAPMQGWSKSLKSDWLPATAALRLQSWTRHSDAQVQQVFLFFLRKKPVSLANHRSPAAIRL